MPRQRAFSLPTGTVTFLLSDVEGSTRRWEDAPEAMAVAIPRHYELFDEAIVAHGGVRPVEQGEGDSVVGAFSRASDAVAAAVAAQRAFAAERWPAGADLRVRMAVHTGEAQLRDRGQLPRPTPQPLRPDPAPPGTAARCWCRLRPRRWSPIVSRRGRRWSISVSTASRISGDPSTSGSWSTRTCRRSSRRCARWTCSATTCPSSSHRSSAGRARSPRCAACSPVSGW